MNRSEAIELMDKLEWAGDTPAYYSGYCKICGASQTETNGKHYYGCQFKDLVSLVLKGLEVGEK